MITGRQFLALCLVGGILLAALFAKRSTPAANPHPPSRLRSLEIGAARTPPPPPVDLRKVLPALASRAKVTVRLHPRRLAEGESLPRDVSKLGGDFLWPASEPWIVCRIHNLPWVGVLQLRKADFPEVEFKRGTDVLQVLWCPQRGHGPYHTPEPVLFWRDAARITRPLKEAPRPHLPTPAEQQEERAQGSLEHDLNALLLFESHPAYVRTMARQRGQILSPSSETRIPMWLFTMPVQTDEQFEAMRRAARKIREGLEKGHRIPKYAEEDFIPHPCRLFPERVTEYPPELSDEEQKRLVTAPPPAPDRGGAANGQERLIDVYGSELSVADGTKLGGYVRWSQGPEEVRCARGHLMEHLLTIASTEWDGASWKRWRAVEEQDLYEQLRAAEDWQAADCLLRPAGLSLGDDASQYVFLCRRCEGWSVRSISQD